MKIITIKYDKMSNKNVKMANKIITIKYDKMSNKNVKMANLRI